MVHYPPLTRAQFDAARMIVARLRAEAADDAFDLEDVGMSWVVNGDPVVVITEAGEQVGAGDFIRAALVLLWSVMCDRAEESAVDPAKFVTELGLGLATHEDEIRG